MQPSSEMFTLPFCYKCGYMNYSFHENCEKYGCVDEKNLPTRLTFSFNELCTKKYCEVCKNKTHGRCVCLNCHHCNAIPHNPASPIPRGYVSANMNNTRDASGDVKVCCGTSTTAPVRSILKTRGTPPVHVTTSVLTPPASYGVYTLPSENLTWLGLPPVVHAALLAKDQERYKARHPTPVPLTIDCIYCYTTRYASINHCQGCGAVF